mmetsp:Transcript_23423/g.38158  ORF Transcript_23423/g.38158 Transcript_23423/m.38158 type:complete len:233 (-) Transcript_23423:167-865(-)
MMTTNSSLSSIIIAAALLSPTFGFFIAPSFPRSNPEFLRSNTCQEIVVGSSSSSKCNASPSYYHSAGRMIMTIQRMTRSDDDDLDKLAEADLTADNDNDDSSNKATAAAATTTTTAAGGGTIALTSAKSAADAATSSSSSNSMNSSPANNTGFSLLLLPTLLLKFTIVLIVKFATDVVVYPTLYLWRWARVGKKKIGRGLGRLLGREEEGVMEEGSRVNGVKANGDSVGDFQ